MVLNVGYIPKDAPHPNAAKLWLDFMLSERGQEALRGVNFTVVRFDLDGQYTANQLIGELGDSFAPIAMGPELLETIAPETRTKLLDAWKESFQGAS